MTDQQLLDRYRHQRDCEAFAEIVVRHGQLVYATARRLAPADADDIAQAVFCLLSEKAAALRAEPSLAGWFYQATRYCARNATKVRQRREHHERGAAAMRKEEQFATDGDYREVLDDGLAAITESYRQVLLLRYLEGLNLEQTAERLGISVPAVAKRAERGLEKLRKAMQAGGYRTSSTALGVAMVQEMSQGLPGSLMRKMTDVASGSAGETITAMAAAAKRGFTVAKIMMMAKVVLVAGLVGGAGLTAAGVMGSSASGPIANEADPKSPGQVRLVRSKMWVDGTVAAALRAAGKSVDTKSQWFSAMLVSTEAVHRVLAKAQLSGGAVDLQQLYSPDQKMTWPGYGPPPIGNGIGQNRSSVVRIQPSFEGKREYQAKADGLQLQLALDGLKAIYFSSAGETSVPASLVFDGKVPGGMALVFVGGFEAEGAYCLDIWEAVRMTNSQGRTMIGVGEGKWFRRTPAQWREFIDRSLVWQEKGKTVERSDYLGQRVGAGVEVRVVGVGRPVRWPGCWWSPSGEPIREVSGEPKTEKTVVALKVITRPEEEQSGPVRVQYTHQWNQIGEHSVLPNGEEMVAEVPDESGKLTVKVADGKWRRLGTMGKDKPLADAGMKASVEGTDVIGTTMCSTSVIGTGLPNGPMRLVALDANDVEVGRSWEPGLIQIGEDRSGPEKRLFLPIHNLSGTPVSFALEACGYEKTTFEGIVMVPKVSPPESVTGDAVKAAEMGELDRKVAEVAKRWEDARKRYEAVKADDTTPQGLFKRMLEAAAAGRKEEVAACLTSPEPSEKDSVQMFIRTLLASTRCCDAVVAKFGLEQVVRDSVKLHAPGRYELMVYNWQIDGERATTDTLTARRFNGDQATPAGLSMRRSNGHWQLEAASIAQKPMTTPVAQWAEGLESISTAIAEGRISTTRQLNDAIEKLPKP